LTNRVEIFFKGIAFINQQQSEFQAGIKNLINGIQRFVDSSNNGANNLEKLNKRSKSSSSSKKIKWTAVEFALIASINLKHYNLCGKLISNSLLREVINDNKYPFRKSIIEQHRTSKESLSHGNEKAIFFINKYFFIKSQCKTLLVCNLSENDSDYDENFDSDRLLTSAKSKIFPNVASNNSRNESSSTKVARSQQAYQNSKPVSSDSNKRNQTNLVNKSQPPDLIPSQITLDSGYSLDRVETYRPYLFSSTEKKVDFDETTIAEQFTPSSTDIDADLKGKLICSLIEFNTEQMNNYNFCVDYVLTTIVFNLSYQQYRILIKNFIEKAKIFQNDFEHILWLGDIGLRWQSIYGKSMSKEDLQYVVKNVNFYQIVFNGIGAAHLDNLKEQALLFIKCVVTEILGLDSIDKIFMPPMSAHLASGKFEANLTTLRTQFLSQL
jgi:hypothetical protein